MNKPIRLLFTVFAVAIGVSILIATAQANETQIKEILQRQTDAWNRQDIEAFMQTYWQSDQLTFSSGGKTTRGWKATLERYKKNYHPPEKMGKLSFDELEVNELGDNAAFVLGRWHLDDGESKKDGNFTLVVKKIDGNWMIVHDHSSIEDKDE